MQASFPDLAGVLIRAQAELVPPVEKGIPADVAAKLKAWGAKVRQWIGDHLNPDKRPLEDALRGTWADSGNAGASIAADALPGAAQLPSGASAVDWSTWVPGNPEAAVLGELLPVRLADLELTVQGITDTQLDLIAGRLADGLWAGSNMDTIGTAIDDIVGTPGRGVIIARTETARAVSEATQSTYAANGIAEWQWMMSEDACPECEALDGNIYPVGNDEPTVPLHVSCRCTEAPSLDSILGAEAVDDSGDGGDST